MPQIFPDGRPGPGWQVLDGTGTDGEPEGVGVPAAGADEEEDAHARALGRVYPTPVPGS